MTTLRTTALLFLVILAIVASATGRAGAAQIDRAAVVAGLCGPAATAGATASDLVERSLDLSHDDAAFAAMVLDAILGKRLLCPAQATDPVTLRSEAGVVEAATGRPLDAPAGAKPPVVGLKNRATFERAAAALTLLASTDVTARTTALEALARRPEGLPDGFFARLAATTTDPALKAEIARITIRAALSSPDLVKRIPAIESLARDEADRRTLTLLDGLLAAPDRDKDARYADALVAARATVERAVRFGDVLATLYNGLSFASILFMASIGLAIIFGLMGIINLAQGEFIMIGAYVTYMVQEVLKTIGPGFAEWYLIVAIPFAFFVTAGVGIALEATLIRHLYRRPLMSLLATWAVSLALVNLVRVGFGTQNLQMITPSYVSGGIPVLGDFLMTWNRLFAIAFAVITLVGTWALVRHSGFGLDIRAVTQNRDMAGCIGIPTRRIDMLAFGFGSGLAGLAGLALSPIYNVNPQMGTQFIIDGFMVVVLGGVGSIVGTVIASLGIGQINVLIEPIWGAVAAKVIVLVLIIGFLQWRPEGLFAIGGRRK